MKKILTIVSIFFIGLSSVYASDTVKFSKCVDGDTIKVLLSDKEYTVRMLAIDTPESVHPTKTIQYYGKEASDYTCKKITNAKKIVLEYDDNSDKTDKYDRLLAWVYVDDLLLQEELVENGYAKVAYLYEDYKYTDILQEKQELASAKNIGIWDSDVASKFDGDKIDTTKEKKDYSTQDIIIIGLLLLIIVFVGNKSIKNKARKKLKKILN